MRIEGERRRFAGAEVSENQTEIFPSRVASHADFCRERFFFRRLISALTGAAEHAPGLHAADRVAFDPAGRELRAAVRAAEFRDMRRACFTSVERKALAH